jgi:hypothetical protein
MGDGVTALSQGQLLAIEFEIIWTEVEHESRCPQGPL